MENFTIDLAQLGRKSGGANAIGSEQWAQDNRNPRETVPVETEGIADGEEAVEDAGAEDLMGDYTIYLDGLGEKPSSIVVGDVEKRRDEVGSDDDGPEDFTVNLEKWMRGAQKWKTEQTDTAAPEIPEAGQDEQGEVQGAGNEEAFAEESVFEPLGISTPAPLRSHAILENRVEEEPRLQAPPISRMNTEMIQDRAAEEVFERISALQAEVERMRLEDEDRRLAYRAVEQENEALIRDHETALGVHQARHAALQEDHERLRNEHQHIREQLRLKEQEPPADHSTKLRSLRAKFEPAVQELASVKADAEADRIAANTKIKALEEELRSARAESHARQSRIDSIEEENSIRIRALTTELETRSNEVALERKESAHRGNEAAALAESIERKDRELRGMKDEVKAIKMELDHAHDQLAETRRIVEAVEDENDRLVQQNDRQAREMVYLESLVHNREAKSQTPEPSIEKVETTDHADINNVPQGIDPEVHKAALEKISQQHKSAVSSLKASHAKEIRTLRAALLKAGQGMQKREARLTKSHASQIDTLNQQLASLQQQQQLQRPQSTQTELENELRHAIRVLSTKLEKANKSLEITQAELEDARRAAEDAESTNAMVNAELEARFAETVEAREREWRRRVEVLFREREKMGKALMWGWGREEVGSMAKGEREQRYRYRFVER